jgi:hypothetical protein
VPVSSSGWWSINELRESIDGPTGYVRTLEMSPHFNAKNFPGTDRVFMWSGRIHGSGFGENRLTLDGLQTVNLIDAVEGMPGQDAPFMKKLSISPSFDVLNLGTVLDIFGCSFQFEQIWQLKNLGTQITPDFQWSQLDWWPGSKPYAVEADPNFSRPGNPRLWVLAKDGLFALDDQSTDWSQFSITEYPAVDKFLPLAMVLPPDMATKPAIFVMTWGGGVRKLDLSQATPTWEAVGIDFPDHWGNSLALSPRFASDRIIVAGTQYGMLQGRDIVGAPWRVLPMNYALDNMNPGIAYYDPLATNNPDPGRRWGWDIIVQDDVPKNNGIDLFGPNAYFTESDGSYLEYTTETGHFSVLTVTGPIMGEVSVSATDFQTGALISQQNIDLGSPTVNYIEVDMVLPQSKLVVIRVEASLTQPGDNFFFDGFRFFE